MSQQDPLASESAPASRSFSRRRALLAAIGVSVGTVAFRDSLAAMAGQQEDVTVEMVKQAAWLNQVQLTEEAQEQTAAALKSTLASFASLREVNLPNHVAPSIQFTTRPFRRNSEPPRRDAQPLDSARQGSPTPTKRSRSCL